MKKQLQPATLTEVLAGLKDDNDRGITFIVTGSKEEFLSYNELYHSALLWLGHLQEKGMQPGDELVLQVDDNRLFLPIFWACILGGIIAVPVSVTHYSENINKLFAIRQCLNNPGFISPASHYEKLLAYDHGNGSGIKQSFHTTLFTEDKHSNKKGKIHQVTSSDIAFIQFSSGSTGHPKGVVLTHKNLITNMYSAITAHQCKGADRHLSWMPLTHDMGLIGFHLYPMAAGVNHYLMPTELFIRNPLLWMQKVSEHNVTITCSPNFGYHYYLNHFTDDKAEGMDLSSLRIILNGAEPVSAALCRTFMKKMGNYHLCSTAMCPGYGLAEATLEVTFSGIREPLKSIFINRTQLTIGSAVIKKENEKDAPVKDAIEVVDLGKSISGVELKITDSEGKKLKDGYIGIIWIKGDAVTKQYYNNKPITKKIIQRGWLNTGDTGLMISGHLYVVGRVKDIIFINGANIYPHDIEQVLEQLPGIGTGKVVACGIPDSNTGSEAIAVFIVHRSSIENFLPLIAKVKKYIATRMGLEVKQVLPIKKMVKTTSGKVRRHFFAEEYDKGTYNTVIGEIDALTNKNKGFSQSQCSSELNGNKEIIRKWITNWLQKQLDLQPHELQAERTFAEYGVTSMQGIAMASALEEALQTPLEYTAIYNFPTIPALTDHVFHTMDSLAETGGAREETGDNRIAIIGIGCRFPGKVNTPEAFWSLLKEQKNAITIIPEERWDIDSYFDTDENVLGKMYTRHGGFIEHATEFDPLFFGISPKEAACMDPQHRLLLEISWEALEQARLIPSQLKGSDSGIFIGMGSDDYQQLIRQAKDPSYFDDAFSSLGLERSIAAGRLAYFLDFHGPVVQLDTACSSSLLSVHQACQSLLSGECNLALAGGVNLMLSPETTIKLCRMNALSPEGLCKTFDDHADGYVRGEGAGMIVLKRLSDAIKNNDPIQAVICGSAVNHDGLSNGLTAPNGAAQQALIKKALRNAGLDNKEIQYVEAHGTGTRLGDPIEVQTLNAVYGHSRNTDQPLILGAVKTNIGHLEAAAGIASLIKTVLCLQHKQIPGNLNYHKPNSFVPWDTMPLKVANSLMDWKNGSVKRRGAVSAFGLSGTNVHMILEEFPKPEISDRRIHSSWPSYPFCLSAKTEEGLKALAKEYSTLLHQTKELMADISYSTVTTRQAFQYRLAMEAGSAADALQGLQSYLSGSGKKEIKYGSVSMQQQKLVWLFTGQGSQYWNMGKELYENNTVFKQVMDRCNAYLQGHLEVPLNTVLYETDEEKSDALLQQTCYTQPALFAIECALAEVWKSWGIVPSMVAGHSVGEYAAAYIAGVFDLEEGLKLIAERARLMQAIKTPGKMIAVFAEEARIIQWISAYGKSISIAAKNGPELIVVSGEQEAMLDLRNTLTQAGIKTKELPVSHAFHSSLMNPVVKEFRKIAERISFRTPTIPIISNLTGEIVTAEIAHADYWCKHITEPVLFSKSIETITASGGELLLELGPQAHLSGMAQLTRDYETGNVLVSMKKGYSSWSSMLEALMSFYIKGISINWDGVYIPMDFRKVQLPVYPFQRQHYWIEQNKLKPAVNAQQNNQEMTANTTTKITTTDIVSDLAAIFSDLLKLPVTAINIHTRFMELGADSLVLLNVIRRIERKYRLNFSVRQVFEEINTLDIMARYIAQHTASTAPPIKVDLFRASSSITEISSKDSSSAHSSETDPSSLIQRQLDIMEQQLKLLSQFGNGKDPGKHSGSSSQVLHEQRSRINPVLPKKALKNGNGAVHRNGQPIFPKIETRQSSDFTAGQQAYLDNFIKRYTEKTKTSKALAQQYRPVLADNRASAGFRFSTKELVYPIQALSCKGSKLRDVDGNEYIDLAMGFGVNLLGHSPESITKALQQKLQQGYLLGPQTPLAGEVAELLTELTGMERVSFHNSGTEAVMTSIRLARTVTGKNKIAVFSGSYHGHFDGTLAIAEDLAATHAGIPMTPGILHNMVADVLIFDYTDPAVIQQIQEHAHELAAVLVEPVQSRRPGYQPSKLLKELRELTIAGNIALIFDEMITGFRIHPGGAQAYFGITADIVTYGKIVGGGLPIGVIAGKSKYMNALDGGVWNYGDDSYPQADTTFFAGTFCKHPLSLTSALTLLKELKQKGPALQEQLNDRTSRLVQEIQAFFMERNVPIEVHNFGSQFYFTVNSNMDLFFYHLLEKGVYIWEGKTCFLSEAHTDADIDFILKAIKESIDLLQQHGFLPAANKTFATEKKSLETVDDAIALPPVISVMPRPAMVPLSFGQERLWFIDQLTGSTAYHIPMALKLTGKLDADILHNTLQIIVNRHEILRTVISTTDEQPCQRVLPWENWQMTITDRTIYKNDAPTLQAYITSLNNEPFDLCRDYMLRAQLIILSEESHVLVLVAHHIAFDGLSAEIILKELAELYKASMQRRLPQLPVQHIQYADYALWQRSSMFEKIINKQITYWENKLKGATALQLPVDHVRIPVDHSKGTESYFKLNEVLMPQLQELSRQQGVTLYMLLLSVFKVLLFRYSGQNDSCIGTSAAGRMNEETEGLIGFFVNTLVLRSELHQDLSFTELVQQVRTTTLMAYENQDVPFEKVIRAVVSTREQGRNPLVQILFEFERTISLAAYSLGNVQMQEEKVERTKTMYDLTFNILQDADNQLAVKIEYCTDLFYPETISRMFDQYEQLIYSVLRTPSASIGRLQMLTEGERLQLLEAFNPKANVYYPGDKTFMDLFQAQVKLTPEATAIVFGERSLTYKMLNERSNQLAHYLKSQGVGTDVIVPVCINRSLEMIVGILGVMKAGGAYVPIDMNYPPERIAYILEDCHAFIALCNRETKHLVSFTDAVTAIALDKDTELISCQAVSNIDIHYNPNDLAYVIYTSGSTGKPKGVMVEHKGMLNHLFAKINDLTIDDSTILAYTASYTFDISVWQMFAALICGGRTIIYSESVISDPETLLRVTAEEQVTILELVPSYLSSLLQEANAQPLPQLRYLILTGEALSQHLLAEWFSHNAYKSIPVVNAYGPTEASDDICHHFMYSVPEHINIPLGKPIQNMRIYILDKAKQLCPIGVPGEICVAGIGVARGYLHLPDLTARYFIKNPFSTEKAERMYCTGDQGRWLPDGTIEFQGRMDDQVKIRGFRIELGEIESVLQQCASVKYAIVLPKTDQANQQRLIAYIIPDGIFSKQEMMDHLKQNVPDYMIPSAFVELEKIPLTINHKLDKQALPDPDFAELPATTFVAPRNELEERVMKIWKELLNIHQLGVYDNFFERGGHSLLAARAVSSIRKQLNIQLTIKDFFNSPTIAQLATYLKTLDNKLLLPSIEVQPRPVRIPLSFSQERLWFIHQLEGSAAYHMSAVFRLNGAIDTDALSKALQTIVNRHEALRTVIIQDADSTYQVVQDKDKWQLGITTNESFNEDQLALKAYVQGISTALFDLSADHMLRAQLIRIQNTQHLLALTIHHIACDGLSTDIIVDELVALYRAYARKEIPKLAALPIQYADYAIWQRSYLTGELLDTKLAYWKDKLKGVVPLNLTTDYVRPAIQSFRGRIVSATIDNAVVKQLHQFDQEQEVTLFMTLLTVFKVLLHRYTGQADICVGTPVAGRMQQELEGLVGFFVNAIALRSEVSGNPLFTDLLQQVKRTTLEAFDHQDIPFEKVVDLIVPERDLSRNPLCPVVFSIQNTPDVSAFTLGDVQLNREELDHTTSMVDLNLSVTENPDGTILLNIEYCSDLFSNETMVKMLVHYKQLLHAVIAAPETPVGALVMLTPAEEHQLLTLFNRTDALRSFSSTETIVNLFSEQVQRTPHAIAAVFKDSSLTYEALDERSDQLAQDLIKKGVEAETLVPVCIERSLEMLIGILGILKAGGAYVPIDPNYPEDRINYLLADTQARFIMGSSNTRPKLNLNKNVVFIELEKPEATPNKRAKRTVDVKLHHNQLAYVIYTSGSTGKPKGVEITQGGLVNLVLSQINLLGLQAGMSMLQFASFSFDASCSEIFTALASGCTLIIPQPEDLLSTEQLSNLIKEHHIQVMTLPPSYQVAMKDHLEDLSILISAGEPLNAAVTKELQSKGIRLFNAYGPTENTVCVTMSADPLLPDGTVTIGKPIHQVRVYIVDQYLNSVPAGVSGELCVGGIQVARGYLNRPELTAEKFIKDPFLPDVSARLYKTGDLAKWLPDGNIVYLGRIDEQVKIAGHRIECGEVEAALVQHPDIESAVVVVNEKNRPGKLAAYYKRAKTVELWPSIAEFFIYDDIVYRSMHTHTSRNDKYKAALQKVIQGKTVLEIGPGPEAVLSRLCIACGAEHVYAVEILEETYLKAKKCIHALGLTDRITLIHSDIQTAVLPEKVDYCVSEIVGSIAGSEGAAVLIAGSKRLLNDPSHMIPARSITRIAAITLDEAEFEYAFSDIAYHYVEQIAASLGADFEFRICLKNLSRQHIISSNGVFEDLHYAGELVFEQAHDITLEITADSIFNGFYVWMDLYLDDVIHFDVLEDQESWIPVYFPIAYPGYPVQKGDRIAVTITRKLASNNLNPDYFIKGFLITKDRKTELNFASYHHKHVSSGNPFYQKLFEGGHAKKSSKLDGTHLKAYLNAYLPEYMIPAVFTQLEVIPLTPNGKVDRRELMKRDMEPELVKEYTAPSNEAEQALVAIWQELLHVEQIGIHDNFFSLGGDSIISIQVVSRARRLGYSLQVGDLFSHQTIAELLPLLSATGKTISSKEDATLSDNTSFGLLPIQQWFFHENILTDVHHYNQSVLLTVDKQITPSVLAAAVKKLLNYHDALRLRFKQGERGWEQTYGNYPGELETVDLQGLPVKQLAEKITETCNRYQQHLNIQEGLLMRSVLLLTPADEPQNRLLFVIHHLAVDGVSWRILLADLELLLKNNDAEITTLLGNKSSSYHQWYSALQCYGQSDRLAEQRMYWEEAMRKYRPLKTDKVFAGKITQADISVHTVRLNALLTQQLLQQVSPVYHTEINDVLISAFVRALTDWADTPTVTIGLEGHGREALTNDVDVSQTVGWFTSFYPVSFKTSPGWPIDHLLKEIKEQLRQVPDKGIGFGVLKYMYQLSSLAGNNPWEVVFNYLGQLDNVTEEKGYINLASEPTGDAIGKNHPVEHKLAVNASVQGGELILEWSFSHKQYNHSTIEELAAAYLSDLEKIISHCISQSRVVFTPSDYGIAPEVHHEELDEFLDADYNGEIRRDQVDSIYRLSGLQEGMLFHSLFDKQAEGYIDQFFCEITNLEMDVFEQSLNCLLQHHSILRSAFYYEEFSIPVQCVYHKTELPVTLLDYRRFSDRDQKQAFMEYGEADRKKGFDFTKAPLMRITLMRTRNDHYRLLWTFHHILLDGWSFAILIEELLNTYELISAGKKIEIGTVDRYEEYIRYVERQNKTAAEAYWKNYLADMDGATLLPFIDQKTDRTKGAGIYKQEVLQLQKNDVSKLSGYVAVHRITINTLMQGVWAYLLSNYTNKDTVTYGVVVSNRPGDLPAIEQRVGLYINTLPLHERMDDSMAISEWLHQLQGKQQRSREYQYTALNTIQQWIGHTGDLFDTIMVFDNYPISETIFGAHWKLQLSKLSTHEKANYPLLLTINASEDVIIQFGYNTSLLTSADVQRIAGHFEQVLLSIINNEISKVGQLTLLNEQERKQLLLFGTNKINYPKDKTVVDLFREQAAHTPDAIALLFENEMITYQELDKRSNQLACRLQQLDVRPQTLVPLFTERSIDMIVGVIGILKAGCAYVPVDQDLPSDRIRYILNDVNAGYMVTSKLYKHKLPATAAEIIVLDEYASFEDLPERTDQQNPTAGDLVYVIYTSGSTGNPKGVMITHGNLMDYLFGLKEALPIIHCTSFGLLSSIATDLGNTVLFSSLIVGGSLHVFSKQTAGNSERLFNYFSANPIDCIKIVPSHWKALATGDQLILPEKLLIFGGEALEATIPERIRQAGSTCMVVNHYGPTETTIGKLLHVVKPAAAVGHYVPVGKPFSNTVVYILNSKAQPVPIGVAGELYIGGDGVAKGYLNNASLTEAHFVNDPVHPERSVKIYRTGDRVKYLPDGSILFIDRADNQIKIRGYRVELAEVERLLERSGLVSQCVVLAKERGNADKYLVAYIRKVQTVDQMQLSAYLTEHLPEYMIPSVWIEVEQFPLLPNGKINRKALPDADAATLPTTAAEPESETQKTLAAIWCTLLEIKEVGIQDDFFTLGGHSLIAIRLVSAIRKQLNASITIGDVFDYPTIRSLAARIESLLPREILPALVASSARPARIPLSYGQERLWFIDQLEGSIHYHTSSILRIKGTLNIEALSFALQTIVNRHEILRTVIINEEGTPYQSVLNEDQWQLTIIDRSAHEENEAGLSAFIRSLLTTAFDLSSDHMLRAHLLKLNAAEYVLVLVIHHIASDAWSSAILVKELTTLYTSYSEKAKNTLPILSVQYADYAIWQRTYLNSEALDMGIRYWKNKLSAVTPLQLPLDRPRPVIQSVHGASKYFRLNKQLTAQLTSLSNQQGTTLFMTILAAFKVLLHRYSNQDDICVGSPVAGRMQADVGDLIGFFVNMLPIRTDLSGNPAFTTLLQQVKQTTIDAYNHQDVPFEKIVEAVVTTNDQSRSPVFQVMFDLQHASHAAQLKLGDLSLMIEQVEQPTTQYDLSLLMEETSDGLNGNVVYCAELFDPSTIARMLVHFEMVLRSIVEEPSTSINALQLIPEIEKQQLVVFNKRSNQLPVPERTITALFVSQLIKNPQAIAVTDGLTMLTYKQLDERSAQIANYLLNKTESAETLIPICMDRSMEMITGIIGILKAGMAYVPIDPDYPSDRISYILSDCKAALMISSSTCKKKLNGLGITLEILSLDTDQHLLATYPASSPGVQCIPSQLAYVMYTSGSTGRPKGVMIEHRNVTAFIENFTSRFHLQPDMKLAATTNYIFDISVLELLCPLMLGSTVYFVKDTDPLNILQLIEEEKIDALQVTPSRLALLLEAHNNSLAVMSKLKVLLIGGEALNAHFHQIMKQLASTKVMNVYGPTETTIWSTSLDIQTHAQLSIGTPLMNEAIYILNAYGYLVPVGVPGEIHIAGSGVGRGYLNRADLTSERFIQAYEPDRSSRKMYRTGDMGRWLADGTIEYLGRMDNQVKLNGYRIELGEIENVLQQCEWVNHAAVIPRTEANDIKRLVAYIVPNGDFVKEKISNFLKEKLPDYMIPGIWVRMDKLPMTANGKIDRRSLPDPDTTQLLTNTYMPPGTDLEWKLAGLCGELLAVDRIGIQDNLFELGFRSILIMRLAAAIQKEFDLRIPVRIFFELSTIEVLAAYLEINLNELSPELESENKLTL